MKNKFISSILMGVLFVMTNISISEARPTYRCQFLFWEVDCAPDPSVDSMMVPNHIRRAKQMIGMNAQEDRARLRSFFAERINDPVDPVRIPWCAAWANAVLAEAGYATTHSLLARSFLNYGYVVREPVKGDIVVLRRGSSNWTGHVGFFVGRMVIDGVPHVAVLGGNQERAINIAYFPESRVLGYRAPRTS